MAPRLLLLVAVALTASTATTTCWAFVPPSPPTNPTPTKPSTTKMDVARLDLYPGLKVSQSVSQSIYSIWIDLTLLREARDCYLAWGAKCANNQPSPLGFPNVRHNPLTTTTTRASSTWATSFWRRCGPGGRRRARTCARSSRARRRRKGCVDDERHRRFLILGSRQEARNRGLD